MLERSPICSTLNLLHSRALLGFPAVDIAGRYSSKKLRTPSLSILLSVSRGFLSVQTRPPRRCLKLDSPGTFRQVVIAPASPDTSAGPVLYRCQQSQQHWDCKAPIGRHSTWTVSAVGKLCGRKITSWKESTLSWRRGVYQGHERVHCLDGLLNPRLSGH